MPFKLLQLLLILVSAVFAQSYQNLTLQNCIDVAKKNSLTLATTKLSEKTAESSLEQAKKARLPGLSGSARQDVVYDYPFYDNSNFSYLESLNMSLSSSMPIYTAGRIGHSINQAGYRKGIAILNSESAERTLSEQVIRAYMQVWSSIESEHSAQASLELSKKILARDSVNFNAGSITAIDLALAFAQMANDSLTLLQAQSTLIQNITSLRQLLEIPQNSEFTLAPPDSAVVVETENYATLLEKAQQNSINKKIDSLSILEADEAIEIAKTGYYPSLNLSGSAGTGLRWKTQDPNYGVQLKNDFNYSASLSMNITLIDWGATKHNVLTAQVAKERAQIDALNTQKQLENAIEQLSLQAETYRLQWEVSSIQMEAQRLALEKSVQQHELGMLDVSSLIQQQTNYSTSKIRHNQAKYSFLLMKSLLDLQTGNF